MGPDLIASGPRSSPQHIPQRFEAADLAAALAEHDQRVAAPEAEIARPKLRDARAA